MQLGGGCVYGECCQADCVFIACFILGGDLAVVVEKVCEIGVCDLVWTGDYTVWCAVSAKSCVCDLSVFIGSDCDTWGGVVVWS